ncbi:hypothetical protein VTK26DRAFT_7232 [Humicola hyalothermophila]
MPPEHQLADLVDPDVRLGREARGDAAHVALYHEQLVQLVELGHEPAKHQRDVVGQDLAQRERRLPVLLVQHRPDGRLVPDVEQRDAAQRVHVDGARQHRRLGGNQVDGQVLERDPPRLAHVVRPVPLAQRQAALVHRHLVMHTLYVARKVEKPGRGPLEVLEMGRRSAGLPLPNLFGQVLGHGFEAF